MLKIFAKYGTTEKVIYPVPDRTYIPRIMERLKEKYGGNWLYVDSLAVNEIIKFNDDFEYKGFHGKDERYCSKIETI